MGSLLYLSNGTRPDLSFAVNKASRYLEKPTKAHWNAVKRILKYLKGTVKYGIKFEKNSDNHLKVYSDADFAGETETRKSTSGYLVKFGSNVITWNSQRQATVALSTTDAEYIAACQAVKEIVWLHKLSKDLGILHQMNTSLYIDNMSAIQLIKNPVYHKRTKHIDVKYHYIREKYEEKLFNLEYINTKNQPADILTKPLARPIFELHRSVMCSVISDLK